MRSTQEDAASASLDKRTEEMPLGFLSAPTTTVVTSAAGFATVAVDVSYSELTLRSSSEGGMMLSVVVSMATEEEDEEGGRASLTRPIASAGAAIVEAVVGAATSSMVGLGGIMMTSTSSCAGDVSPPGARIGVLSCAASVGGLVGVDFAAGWGGGSTAAEEAGGTASSASNFGTGGLALTCAYRRRAAAAAAADVASLGADIGRTVLVGWFGRGCWPLGEDAETSEDDGDGGGPGVARRWLCRERARRTSAAAERDEGEVDGDTAAFVAGAPVTAGEAEEGRGRCCWTGRDVIDEDATTDCGSDGSGGGGSPLSFHVLIRSCRFSTRRALNHLTPPSSRATSVPSE